MKYDFEKIEKKWQKQWRKEGVYEPDLDKTLRQAQGKPQPPPFYNLMMFPYPSAEGLHVGNMYAFVGSDIYGRYKRMRGYDVFEPIGLDGFGIHSENYALKTGVHPMEQAKVTEERFYKQLEAIGNGFAWEEKLETYDPQYYRWTQWLFIQMFKNGLAYRKRQEVNWCPSCKTVLADEQVIEGKCERCGTEVVKKDLEQWFFGITKYAERLFRNLDDGFAESAKPNYVLLHGFGGSPERNFFPWLKKELEKKGYKVQVPLLPHADRTKANEKDDMEALWKSVKFDENTILLGHSLGAVAALKAVEKLKHPIRKLILVGGFLKPEFRDHDRPFAKSFDWNFNFEKIRSNARKIVILHDLNDDAILRDEGERLHKALGGELIEPAPAEPHFSGSLEESSVLAACLGSLDWSEKVKIAQRAWIGRSEGVNITSKIKDLDIYFEAFDSVPQTFMAQTFTVIAPEHPLVHKLVKGTEFEKPVLEFVKKIRKKKAAQTYGEELEPEGIFTGRYVDNPFGTGNLPIWVASYAVMDYGSGIVHCSAHDERDFAFAKKYDIPLRPVMFPPDKELAKKVRNLEISYCRDPEGILEAPPEFKGKKWDEVREEAIRYLEKKGIAKRAVNYRLRDWLISRQRYWGPPIPIIYCRECWKKSKNPSSLRYGIDYASFEGEEFVIHPVPEEDLPVKLPYIENFRPTGSDKSPLTTEETFYKVKCPQCKAWAYRETDVSDTFLDSAWYYLRYLNPKITKEPFDGVRARSWLPVHMYIGGAEHAVLHLLYVRFVAMALHDWKLTHFDEPMQKFRAHGLLIKDGAKMSKSKGNVVNPDEYIQNFGADALRMYLMFLAPFEEGGDFRDQGILGTTRFLDRVWKLSQELKIRNLQPETSSEINSLLHQTIKKITEDIERLHYNTAISALMIFLNALEKDPTAGNFEAFLKLLAPFAPHMTEEIWRAVLGNQTSIHRELWPEYDEELAKEKKITLVIQINGRVRDTIEAEIGLSEEQAQKLAFSRERIQTLLGKQKPKKIIYVPDKLINIVI